MSPEGKLQLDVQMEWSLQLHLAAELSRLRPEKLWRLLQLALSRQSSKSLRRYRRSVQNQPMHWKLFFVTGYGFFIALAELATGDIYTLSSFVNSALPAHEPDACTHGARTRDVQVLPFHDGLAGLI